MDVGALTDVGTDTPAHVTDGGVAPADAPSDVMDATVTATDASGPPTDGGGCSEPDAFNPPQNQFAPGTVTATILDLTGTPVLGLNALLCGIDLCAGPAVTDPTGALSTSMTFPIINPALQYGDSLTYPEWIVPVTTVNESLGTLHTTPFPTTGPTLTAGTAATSGPLTLILPSDDVISMDTLVYTTPAQQEFRAVTIPMALAAVDPSVGLEVIIGTTPQETLFCPPVQASIANTAAWPAGAAVDFYALGIDVTSFFAPYGGWAVISTGHVSADGSTVTTDPGAGLWVLTSLGVRQH
jgi:hypothetical protein